MITYIVIATSIINLITAIINYKVAKNKNKGK